MRTKPKWYILYMYKVLVLHNLLFLYIDKPIVDITAAKHSPNINIFVSTIQHHPSGQERYRLGIYLMRIFRVLPSLGGDQSIDKRGYKKRAV